MDFQLPELGEGVYEAELVAWRVRPGELVKPGQILMEALTDKATMEVPAPFSGVIESLSADAGSTIKVGDIVLTYVEKSTASGQQSTASGQQSADCGQQSAGSGKSAEGKRSAPVSALERGNGTKRGLPVQAAPSVRLLARKLGIDIASVRGSGPHGRILVDDLTSHVRPHTAGSDRPGPAFDVGKPGAHIKVHGIRRKIADRMVHAKRTAPHYSYVDECDVSDLVRLRDSLREPFSRQGVKITYLAFVVKAAAGALREVPLVNASLDDEAGEIVLHESCNIGIAVATSAGLVVPVIRDADRKSLIDTAREVERLSAAARAGKIKVDDLRDGTFTVTSIGNVGGLISTPIINHPEVGILGLGKIVKRPMYNDAGAIYPADIVYLSFSFDHRVLDGAIGALFGNAVLRRLKNPAALLAGIDA